MFEASKKEKILLFIVMGIFLIPFFSIFLLVVIVNFASLYSTFPIYVSIPITIVIIVFLILSINSFIKKTKNFISFRNKYLKLDENEDYFSEAMVDSNLVKEAYENFIKIMQAYSKNDIGQVRGLLSEIEFTYFRLKVNKMISENQKNIISDFQLVKGWINKHNTFNDYDEYIITFHIKCKNYVIDINTNQVITGDSNIIKDYFYALSFKKNKLIKVLQCPNCNSILPVSYKDTNCPYCSFTLDGISNNLVLSYIKLLQMK